ncbi:hypothetical protein [Niallia sp. Man26]|nr:hypothetical protein [Niallia sp. Man26]UPO90519.1 hypothetical protein L8T27_020925 [Niallia sp. Man26]
MKNRYFKNFFPSIVKELGDTDMKELSEAEQRQLIKFIMDIWEMGNS